MLRCSEFYCQKCSNKFERLAEDASTKEACPACKKLASKCISAPRIRHGETEASRKAWNNMMKYADSLDEYVEADIRDARNAAFDRQLQEIALNAPGLLMPPSNDEEKKGE